MPKRSLHILLWSAEHQRYEPLPEETFNTAFLCMTLRAARWYEAQGALREALAHALSAADFAYAAHQMVRAAEFSVEEPSS